MYNEDLTLPRRVLMTADTAGGVWTYALELARALGEQRVEVALATMGSLLTREQRQAARQIENLTVFESCYRLEWMDDPWSDAHKAGDWLLWLERHLRPDVIHLNGYAQGALPWRAPALVVGHSCVLSWWRSVKGTPAPSTMNRYWYEVEKGLQAVPLVVAPTREMLAALKFFYGPLLSVKVIPHGRSPEAFAPGEKQPFILAAGRLWDEAKNIETLAAAAPELEWPVLVAGDPYHPDRRPTHYENLSLLGPLEAPALAARYAAASIYVLPARYAPFGLSALEAALAGCALVLGDIPSLREVWGDNALFVAPGDRAGLAAAIRSLIRDPERRRNLAERARAQALGYTPQRMVGGYLEAYREIMNYRAALREYADYR